jgi:hypothetical protein
MIQWRSCGERSLTTTTTTYLPYRTSAYQRENSLALPNRTLART